jgi:hypothetical protein
LDGLGSSATVLAMASIEVEPVPENRRVAKESIPMVVDKQDAFPSTVDLLIMHKLIIHISHIA